MGRGGRRPREGFSHFFPCLPERGGGGPSRSWFAFFCVLVWFLMASVLFPLSQPGLFLGNSGGEYQLRGGSCIVPITAVCGHIPTIKTQKEKGKKENTPTKSLSSVDPREDWEFGCLAKCLMESLKEFLLHTLLLMTGQPVVSLKPRVSGVKACS